MSRSIYCLQKAIESIQSGDLSRAEDYAVEALKITPKSFDCLNILGSIKLSRGKIKDALNMLLIAESLKKNDFSLQFNLAKAYMDDGKYIESLQHHRKAIFLNSNNPDAYINYAKSLCEINQIEEAINCYDKAINIDPKDYEVWFFKGLLLGKQSNYEAAVMAFDTAVEICPTFWNALISKADILNNLNRYDEALAHYDRAIQIKPDYAEAWSNKAVTLHALKRYDEALAHYDRAIQIKPDYAEAWLNKSLLLNELRSYEDVIFHYEKVLALNPDIDWVTGDLLHTKMKVCIWSNLEEFSENVSKKLVANEKVTAPFPLLALNDDVILHKKTSEIYIQSKYPYNPILGPILKRERGQKIRIGYFSADFHNHATGYLMAELFELHDKTQFELFGFSFGPMTNDEMRQRLKKSFDQFIEVGGKSDIEVASLSRYLNIDIAIDLKGFTQDARTGIFSYRAAPIQINWLGYPGTMGTNYIDYIIADRTIISPEIQSFYSEKVVYLPNSYQVNDRRREISDRKFTRHQLGLPEHGFVFCCFNNNFKILPVTFVSWMRILKAVEGSVLWLLQDNLWAAKNLRREAEKQGIAAERLVFAERLPMSEHLARHRQADLFLDTAPYNAHTTTSDALWVELPVLTLMGRSFASRVAASLLNAIGLSELITDTQEEYENLAIELATNPEKLNELKKKLSRNRFTEPLFNTPLFTKHIEAAYTQMYERYTLDLKPDHISIV